MAASCFLEKYLTLLKTTMHAPPILLTSAQLLEPVSAAQKKLSAIRSHLPSEPNADLFREGLFVLAVATVEFMLADVFAVFLRQIPSRLPDKNFTVSKEALVATDNDLLENQIQNYLMSLGYKRLDEFIGIFSDHLSINLKPYLTAQGDSLQELKESRNLLLHNDLRTNAIYLAKAGKKSRSQRADVKLTIDFAYFNSSLHVLEELCTACEVQITAKYKSYTKAKAIKALWSYIFQTPILSFDDYWEVNTTEDTVHLKTLEFRIGISSSEEMFLGIWLNHYNQSGSDFLRGFTLQRLDERNRSKMLWLLNVLKGFRVY